MRILEVVTYAAVAFHFLRLSVRAVAMGIHQAFDSTGEELARGLNLTKIVEKEIPTKADATKTEVRKYEVPDTDKVTWLTRLKVLGTQFLAN